MNSRIRKFISYYKPYRGLFFADIICALIVSITTLLIPLCVRYITKNILTELTPDSISQIYLASALAMQGLVATSIYNQIWLP